MLVGWLEASQTNFQGWQEIRAQRQAMYAIYDACFAWTTVSRSERDLQVPCALKCACGLTRQLSPTHQRGQKSFRNSTHYENLVLHLLITMLFPYADNLNTNGRIINFCRMHTFSQRRWPCSAQKLWPYGGDDTLHALVRLLRPEISGVAQVYVYYSFHIVFAYRHPLITPFFVTSSLFVDHAITWPFDQVFDRLKKALQDSGESYRVAQNAGFSLLHKLSAFVVELISVNLTQAQRYFSHGNSSRELVMASSTALHALEIAGEDVLEPKSEQVNTDSRHLKSQFIALGGQVYRDCPEVRQIQVHLRALSRFRKSADLSALDQGAALVQLMYHLETRQRCMALGCHKTRLEGNLKHRSGCERVP